MTSDHSVSVNAALPMVSVIIPVYNGGESIRRCLNSLQRIDYAEQLFEVIVVDDGSMDETTSWLTQKGWPSQFKIICHNENRGRSQARNTGIRTARGDILIFLDGDMVVEPTFVAEHVKVMRSDDVVAVTGAMYADPALPRTKLSRYLFEYTGRGAKQIGEQTALPFHYLLTGNMSIKKHILDEIGLFDESFEVYGGEDTLFAFRLSQKYPNGLRYAAAPKAYDQNQHDLDSILDKMQIYGRENLPVMVQENPELLRPLHAQWVLGSKIERFLGRLLFHSFGVSVVKLKLKILPPPLSHLFIRYLMAAAMITGLRTNSTWKV